MKTFTQEDLDEYYEDEPEPINCPMCEKRGYLVQLGPKILMPGETRPEDYDQFLQCPTCYWICPIYEIPKEETIKNSIETVESPFDSGKFILESIPKRSSAAGKRAIAKRSRKKIKLDDDKEIDTLLRVYGDKVRVLR
jgi:hypothetical protein